MDIYVVTLFEYRYGFIVQREHHYFLYKHDAELWAIHHDYSLLNGEDSFIEYSHCPTQYATLHKAKLKTD